MRQWLSNSLIFDEAMRPVLLLLGSSRSLFGSLKQQDIELQHLATRTIDGGYVQIKYRISTLKE